MKLLKIKLEDFKGFTGQKSGSEFCFGKRNLVEGRNAVGKSTLMDAHLWLFTDKDSKLKSNPDIRPNDGHECIPRVEEEWEINGAVVTIAKMQKKSVGKPNEKGVSKITLSNKYEINGRPLGERDFKKDLAERGFDFDNFLPLSHIDVFVDGNTGDMKKVLFGMTTAKTDEEIASELEDCGEVALLLKSYRADEIEAMNKASKKKAEEQLQAIPNQIIGMEKSKVNIDTAELELQRNELKSEISKIEEQLSSLSSDASLIEDLSKEIWDLRSKNLKIITESQEKLKKERDVIADKVSNLNNSMRSLENELRTAVSDLESTEKSIKDHADELKKAQEDYTKYSQREFDESELKRIEQEQFDEDSLVCPTCGQVYPQATQERKYRDFEESKKKRISEQESLRTEFEQIKEKNLARIIESGNKAKQDLESAKESKRIAEQKKAELEQKIELLAKDIKEASLELDKFPVEVDLSGNEEYQAIQKQISDKEKELESMDNGSEYRKEKETDLKEKQQELSLVEAEIAKSENDVRIDEQIVELQKKQQEYGQKKADAGNILNQLALVSQAKNTLLEKEINSHFNGARFKLFDYQKNGEYKEVCIPEIMDENGEWKAIGSTANTALEMKGKLAIVDGLQKFYETNYPVFVDFAAEFDNNTLSQIQTDLQVIFLRVSNGDLKVEEMT